MRQRKFFRELGERACAIYRIQVLALEVFDNRELQFHTIGLFADADNHRDFPESYKFRRAQAALSGDEFIARLDAAAEFLNLFAGYGKRLKHAVLADGFRKAFEAVFIEFTARLVRIRLNLIDFNPKD
jgi:hypothetical protein